MTQTYGQARQLAEEYIADEKVHRRQLAHVANSAMNGQINAVFQVTLTPSATSTTVIDPRISIQTAPLLVPLTASAAAAASGLYVVPTAGQAVINHASNPATDQTFAMAILG